MLANSTLILLTKFAPALVVLRLSSFLSARSKLASLPVDNERVPSGFGEGGEVPSRNPTEGFRSEVPSSHCQGARAPFHQAHWGCGFAIRGGICGEVSSLLVIRYRH